MVVPRRRQRMKQALASGRNLRAAVEATVRELSCRFNNAKVRVRGQYRVSMTLLAAAAMTNARRIWRHQQAKRIAARQTITPLNRSDVGIDEKKSPFTCLIRHLRRNLRFYSTISPPLIKIG